MKKLALLSLLVGVFLSVDLLCAQETKIYNITSILDQSDANLLEMPRVGFCNELVRQGVQFNEQQNREQRAKSLIEFIKRYIAPEQWQDKSRRIYCRDDLLYVSQSKDVHAQITALFAELIAVKQTSIALDVKIYEMAPEAFASYWLKNLTTAELPPMTTKNPQIKLLAQEKINTFPGQYIQLARLRKIWYLRDQSIEIAEGSNVYDPIIGKIHEGHLFAFRTFLAADGKNLYLQGTASSAQCRRPIRSYYGESKKRKFLQLPVVAIEAVQGTTMLPSGRPTIVGLYSNNRYVRLLVATASVVVPHKKASLPKLWPAHYLVEVAKDYPLAQTLPPLEVTRQVPITAAKAEIKEMPNAPFALPDDLLSHLQTVFPGKQLPPIARYGDWFLAFADSQIVEPEIMRMVKRYSCPVVIRLGYYEIKNRFKQEVLARFAPAKVVDRQQYEWLSGPCRTEKLCASVRIAGAKGFGLFSALPFFRARLRCRGCQGNFGV